MKGDDSRIERALRKATQRLNAVGEEIGKVDAADLTGDDWLELRSRIGVMLSDLHARFADVDHVLSLDGAQGRLLRYLQLHQGQTVSKDELSGVAGISEWARRVRELRQDLGWAIHSSVTRDDLAVGEYRLESDHPDDFLARDWAAARQMRTLKTAGGTPSPRVRVLEFLKAVFPRSADAEQLAHVAKSAQGAQEALVALRDEGWSIVDATADPKLARGEYRLDSLTRTDD